MKRKSPENLKTIRFAGELLPQRALVLDVAARLCPADEGTRSWFSRLARFSGVDDSRTILEHCVRLRQLLQAHRASVVEQLQRSPNDLQPSQVLAAWMYSLDTMIQQARESKTCSWIIEGAEDFPADDAGGGDITLRRV